MILDDTEVVLWGFLAYLISFVVALGVYSAVQARRSSSNFLTRECFSRLIIPEIVMLVVALAGGFFIEWLVQGSGASKSFSGMLYLIMGMFLLHSTGALHGVSTQPDQRPPTTSRNSGHRGQLSANTKG